MRGVTQRHVLFARPFFQNVTLVVTLRESNLKLCIDEIEKRGYAVECILLDAEWFGLPQSRRRVYFVCLDLRNQDIAVSAASFFEDVKTLIRQMYLEAPAFVSRLILIV